MSAPPPIVPLDTYWGVIQAGVGVRASTAQLWDAVRLSVAEAGETLGPGAFQRMNQLRGLAVEQRNKDAALARLSPTDAITGQHIATDINSRDALQRGLSPRYRVGFNVEATQVRTGETFNLRLTDTFGSNLPATVGDLIDTLNIEAPSLVESYGLFMEAVAGGLSIREV